MSDEQETKVCPHCDKEIKAIAKKCKYCGEWVDKPVGTTSQTEMAVASSTSINSYTSVYILTTLCMTINITALVLMLISFLK